MVPWQYWLHGCITKPESSVVTKMLLINNYKIHLLKGLIYVLLAADG